MVVSLFVAHEHVANGDEDGQQCEECYFQVGGHCLLVCLPFSVELHWTLFGMPVAVLPMSSVFGLAVVVVFGFVGIHF